MKKSKSKTSLDHIVIRQTKSMSGRSKQQRATLVGLGLGKIGRISKLAKTPDILGMIETVQHLIVVENSIENATL